MCWKQEKIKELRIAAVGHEYIYKYINGIYVGYVVDTKTADICRNLQFQNLPRINKKISNKE